MNEYKKEKDIIDGLKKEAQVSPNKCDWRDPSEIAVMKAEESKRLRKALLDKIVPTRICPSCRRRIFLDSSWVVKKGLAICRSCFHSRGGMKDEEEISGGFLKDPIVRFEFDGWKILCLRKRAGVGVSSFADRMGWTKKYQYEIERGVVNSLSLETVEKLIKVFESFGVIITDGG